MAFTRNDEAGEGRLTFFVEKKEVSTEILRVVSLLGENLFSFQLCGATKILRIFKLSVYNHVHETFQNNLNYASALNIRGVMNIYTI